LPASVKSTIGKYQMIKPGQRVCVAVSGGPDSTALLHAMIKIAPELSILINVCHFDHAIRPESVSDAKFVQSMANELGLRLITERDSSPPARSIQAQARERRYSFFERLVKSGYADLVATAHTMDDSVETSIMWMLRGAGPLAFGGMSPVRGVYIRPLIETRKKDVVTWLEGDGIGHVHDKSNDTDKYLRNRIRRHIIPALEQQAPEAVEAVSRLAGMVRGQGMVVDQIARRNLESAIVESSGESVVIDPALVRSSPESVRKLMYRAALESIGLDLSRLTMKHADAVDYLATRSTLGKCVTLPCGFTARIDHAGLTLARKKPEDHFGEAPFACPLERHANGYVLRVAVADDTDANGEVVSIPKIPDGALFRTRQPGDYLRLSNTTGRKKLKSFLIDRKTPSGTRSRIPLLANGSEILWIPGLYLAPSIAVNEEVENTARLQWVKE